MDALHVSSKSAEHALRAVCIAFVRLGKTFRYRRTGGKRARACARETLLCCVLACWGGGGRWGSGVVRHGLAIEAHPATPAASQRTYAIREIRRGGIVYTSD